MKSLEQDAAIEALKSEVVLLKRQVHNLSEIVRALASIGPHASISELLEELIEKRGLQDELKIDLHGDIDEM